MTKQHFIAFAEEIRHIELIDARVAAFRAVCRVAKRFNPRFDEDRFAKACAVPVEEYT